MSFVMMGSATIVLLIIGFSLSFSDGGSLNACIGNPFTYSFFENVPEVWDRLQIPGLSFAFFQGNNKKKVVIYRTWREIQHLKNC